MENNILINHLTEVYGDCILPVSELPKAYCPGGISNVRAIYLGCDPSNKHSSTLPYAFAHESGLKIFTPFILSHTEQLNQIGLNWNSVYTQNLCQNYFRVETSKNKVWKKVAEEFWIDRLRQELELFNPQIPVLLTSQYLLEVLATGGDEKVTAPDFYTCKHSIPIPADWSKLNRPLIPVYRGKSPWFEVSYHLNNEAWSTYRSAIRKLLYQ